jgi:hypothetical protein
MPAIFSDKRHLKEVRSILASVGTPSKRFAGKLLAEAKLGDRGDIVCMELMEDPDQTELVFIKYRERLGLTATVFVQPVFAIRTGPVPDKDIGTYGAALILVTKRLQQLQAAVSASGGTRIDVTLSGSRGLLDPAEAILQAAGKTLRGIPVFVNGQRANEVPRDPYLHGDGPQYAEPGVRAALKYVPIEVPEPDPLMGMRRLLKLAPRMAWMSDELDSGLLDEDVRQGYVPISECGDLTLSECTAREMRQVCSRSGVGEQTAAAIVAFADLLDQSSGTPIMATRGGTLVGACGLFTNVEISHADDSEWRFAVDFGVNPMMPPKRSVEGDDDSLAIGSALARQAIAHCQSLVQSALEHTERVTVDLFFAHPYLTEEDVSLALVALMPHWMKAYSALVPKRASVGQVVAFCYPEDEVMDRFEAQGFDVEERRLGRRFPKAAPNTPRRRPRHALSMAAEGVDNAISRNIIEQIELEKWRAKD